MAPSKESIYRSSIYVRREHGSAETASLPAVPTHHRTHAPCERAPQHYGNEDVHPVLSTLCVLHHETDKEYDAHHEPADDRCNRAPERYAAVRARWDGSERRDEDGRRMG